MRNDLSLLVWQVGHWLDHIVHWLYALSDRLEKKVDCWFCGHPGAVVQYYGMNTNARGEYVCTDRFACKERQSAQPFDPDRVMYDSGSARDLS